MATSVTLGKWCPFARSWVPTRIADSPVLISEMNDSIDPLRLVESLSMRRTGNSGNIAVSVCSIRWVPRPSGESWLLRQDWQRVMLWLMVPQ